MPPKRQFGKYPWDPDAEVPVRSKYRFKQRASLDVPSSSRTVTGGSRDGSATDSSSESGDEDTPRCAPEVAATDSSEGSLSEDSLPSTTHAVANGNCIVADGVNRCSLFPTDTESESSDDSTDSECQADDMDSSHREQQFTEHGADELVSALSSYF